MAVARFSEWHKLPVSLSELCINTTLRCGQSFRWQRTDDDEWRCVLHGRVLSLRQDETHLHYRTYSPPAAKQTPTSKPSITSDVKREEPGDDTEALIRSYFNLGPNLATLYEQWSAADPNFKKKAPRFTGVRILRQDAWEALIAFICSSNNNIARISQMVQKLCINYGRLIGRIDGIPYHSFPSPSALADRGVETRLRELGFGYRAKYIYQTAVMVAKERGGEAWLNSLRNPEAPAFGVPVTVSGDNDTIIKQEEQEEKEVSEEDLQGYRIAHDSLLELQGVGPKVADCVCLMGLGWGEAVPVDTHVWQIAQRDYKFGKGKHKSLTKATYDAIGDHFRRLWGKEAGWAHSVLFTADLRSFSDRLSTTTKVEVKEEAANDLAVRKLKVEETGSLMTKAKAEIKEEAANGFSTVKIEKVEDDALNDHDLMNTKLKVKHQESNEIIKTDPTENTTSSNGFIKTETPENNPNDDGSSPTKPKRGIPKWKYDIAKSKTEAGKNQDIKKDGDDAATRKRKKSALYAVLKRQGASQDGEGPRRSKRVRGPGRG